MADDRPLETVEEAIARLDRQQQDFQATMVARLNRKATGDIEPTIRSTPKADTLILNGQTVNRADYPGLWQWAQDQGLVISGLFTSGDGSTTFGLPNMCGRFPIGVGSLGSDDYDLGELGGSSTVTLTENQMPSHDHTGSTNSTGSHGGHFPGSQFFAVAGADYGLAAWNSSGSSGGSHSHTVSINDAGGGQAHENKPPYLAWNWLIWT